MNNLNDTLPGLMQRATENLEPVSNDLLERSVRQGVRLRRRRTTLLSVAGASAVAATVGLVVGATQLVGGPSEAVVAGPPSPSTTPVATPVAPKATGPTVQEALGTLRGLVQAPGRKLSQPQTWGDASALGAAYVVDDGKGASRVDVLLTGGGEMNRCAEAGARCTTLPDGSKVFSLAAEPTYAGSRNVDGVVANYVARYLPDGRFMSLTSYNAPAEKGSPHTRAKPLFTVAQLTELVQSPAWKLPDTRSVVKPSKGATPPPSKTK
ncbi:hypothetical protein ACIBL3_39025 [Kribbella sp. NPDC050124]|uniref:hypothetical protein n=1 Tax=Kribbella sp. NPDC050124 TaxID=3364114 RepID=UPI0037B3FE1A